MKHVFGQRLSITWSLTSKKIMIIALLVWKLATIFWETIQKWANRARLVSADFSLKWLQKLIYFFKNLRFCAFMVNSKIFFARMINYVILCSNINFLLSGHHFWLLQKTKHFFIKNSRSRLNEQTHFSR